MKVAHYRYTGKAERVFQIPKDEGKDVFLNPGETTGVTDRQLKVLSKLPTWKQLLDSFVLQPVESDLEAEGISTVPIEAAEVAIAYCNTPYNLQQYARNAHTEEVKKLIVKRAEELTNELKDIQSLFPPETEKRERRQRKQEPEEVTTQEPDQIRAKIAKSKNEKFLRELLTDKRASVSEAAIARLKELNLWTEEDNTDTKVEEVN